MVQMMPGTNEHLITMIEDTVRHAPHVTTLIEAGAGPEDLLREALGEVDFEVLEEKEVAFRCNCSFERAKALIASLGKAEVRSMLEDDKGATMTCGFCNETYRLSEADLEEMLGA